MTIEEAIAKMRDHMEVHRMHEPQAIKISEALEMGVNALLKEQGVPVKKHLAPHDYPYNTGACPKCLQQLDEGDEYCRSCGNKMIWD